MEYFRNVFHLYFKREIFEYQMDKCITNAEVLNRAKIPRIFTYSSNTVFAASVMYIVYWSRGSQKTSCMGNWTWVRKHEGDLIFISFHFCKKDMKSMFGYFEMDGDRKRSPSLERNTAKWHETRRKEK